MIKHNLELRVGSQFKIITKIGCGAFGDEYQGINIRTNEEVTIKLEPVRSKHTQLLYETKMYRILDGKDVCIPKIHWYGVEGDYNVMVTELLGASLEEQFDYCDRKFNLKTVLMIADQVFQRLQYIHSKHIIHRDIKPENFRIGTGKKQHLIYLTDFGLGKRYIDEKTGMHIPYRDGKAPMGTARYSSCNNQVGIEQSRRDDLESLGYMMIYFLNSSLPWQGIACRTKREKYEKIRDLKLSIPVHVLCEKNQNEFRDYLLQVRDLKFDANPDTAGFRNQFQELYVRLYQEYDYLFDWQVKKTNLPSSITLKKVEEGKDNENNNQ